MRKAPKVMPRTAASPSPRSAGGGGRQHRHAVGGPLPTPIPATALSPARNSLLAVRQLSFTVTSRTFSKMVLFCGDGGWGERGETHNHSRRTGLGAPRLFGDRGCCSRPGSATRWCGTNPPGCHHQWWGPAWWHHEVGGVTHADLQAGLAREGGREGNAPILGDGVGEAEAPDLPPVAAGGALQHGHPHAARLPTLHQQHRLPPWHCQ